MKITLENKSRAELTQRRDELAKLLAELTGEQAGLAKLEKQRGELQTEIAALESDDDLSEATAAKLSTKRQLLEKITGKIAETEKAIQSASSPIIDKTNRLLRGFTNTLRAAMQPVFDAYISEIAKKIRGYCIDDAGAAYLASTLPACMSLCGTYSHPFGGSPNINFLEIKRAIALADEILSENLKWSFDPKIA
jgi:hypothetical protein